MEKIHLLHQLPSSMDYTRGPQPLGSNPGDLRYSRCNNKRNKVHNKCNVLESSQKHPPFPDL